MTTSALDFATETPLTLAAAARRLPPLRNNRPVHPATILRWVADPDTSLGAQAAPLCRFLLHGLAAPKKNGRRP